MKEECKDHNCDVCRLLKDFARAYLIYEHTKYGKLKQNVSVYMMRHYHDHLQYLLDNLDKLEKQLEQPEILDYLNLITILGGV